MKNGIFLLVCCGVIYFITGLPDKTEISLNLGSKETKMGLFQNEESQAVTLKGFFKNKKGVKIYMDLLRGVCVDITNQRAYNYTASVDGDEITLDYMGNTSNDVITVVKGGFAIANSNSIEQKVFFKKVD